MAKIPFKVSARAARLIGRENVATSQGAITELVKNAYDADATACALIFLPRWSQPPKLLSEKQFVELQKLLPVAEELYPLLNNKRHLIANIDKDKFANLEAALKNILDLWIIDNGHGMSASTIEDSWMVIGTDVKEINESSRSGLRVVTGAKGIGRFALDRLGQECELYSAEKHAAVLVHWYVDWGDFEGKGKIIDDVEAVLEVESGPINAIYIANKLESIIPAESLVDGLCNPLLSENGTAIKISYLHDEWDQRDSLKLKQTLEALLPPKERGDFNIYVYDHRAIDNSGWIDNFPPDQFDYRLYANILKGGVVSIRIDRQEIDASKIRPSVFEVDGMKTPGFCLQDFIKGSYEYKTDLKKLLKIKDGNSHEYEDLLAIGPFDFMLYFFKLANPTEDNLKRYPQKSFDVVKRRQWLKNSGGIRIYRDGFRVRPYGEPNTQGSDWLLLGQRVASNPAAAKRLNWRVPPQQLAGTIHITKAENPLLSDQSNREGIMNERAFARFREIVTSLIKEFERDRGYIYNHFDSAYESDHQDQQDINEGKQLAENIINAPIESLESSENLKIAKAFKSEELKNEALRDDIQVMRGMATLGTVLVSFTHELKQIKANMGNRRVRMEDSLRRVIDKNLIENLPTQINPYNLIERWSREDEKVSRWVDFALSAVSPIKRRRRIIDINDYLSDLLKHWYEFLSSRQISLSVDCEQDISTKILAHEIDLDSVFYNLIINSVEVFVKPSDIKTRNIWIDVAKSSDDVIRINYKDNGPGLSKYFNVESDIFMFGTSSKPADESADTSGTGIGMWLVKNIVDDYKGEINIRSKIGENGFSISMDLPLHRGVE